MSSINLVQRMTRNAHPSSRAVGLDRAFKLEYMGSAEFEWGSVPQSLRTMRTDPVSVSVRPLTIDGGSRDVHLVCPTGDADESWDELLRWVTGDGYRQPFEAKEFTRFDTAFAGADTYGTVAWWTLDVHFMWALDADVAADLADAVNTKPAK